MSPDHDLERLFRQAVTTLAQTREQLRRAEASKREPIAIVGAGLRLPGGVADLEGLWELLVAGRDTLRPLDERFDAEAFFDPDPEKPDRSYVRHANLLDDVAGFDAALFGLHPREALRMDPQHRLLLEAGWTALENAQLDPRSLKNSPTGVFVGIGPNEYSNMWRDTGEPADAYDVLGSATSFAAGRLAYHLGLQGPALTLDTACSSSLVAVHLACRALRGGECDIALAGAVQVLADPTSFIQLSRTGALAPDGRCKTFSELADGYGRGEGVGVLALARLETARARGLKILGLIRGSSVNSDGASSGITVPNGVAQQRVIRAALADAGLAPAEVDVIECHGTGTRLGDPIEVNALAEVYGQGRQAGSPLRLGAIKATIGHLESAAGIAGVLKTLAALHHEALPATPHTTPRNAAIDWEQLPVQVVDELIPWPRRPDRARRAGVSSFGISGTNAHVIIEEAPSVDIAPLLNAAPSVERAPSTGAVTSVDALPSVDVAPSVDTVLSVGATTQPTVFPIVVSGLTRAALSENTRRLTERLESNDEVRVRDLSYSLATTRTAFPMRFGLAVAATHSAREVAGALRAGLTTQLTPEDHRPGKLALLFSGQGAQRLGMGKSLAKSDAHFARLLDEALTGCDAHLDRSLRDVLWADPDSPDGCLLHDTQWTQPALFAVEVALARRYLAFGARPELLIGHSIGEIAAAQVAEVLTFEDAARLVCARGALMSQLATVGGTMASLGAGEAAVREVLAAWTAPERARVDIAALNAPDQTVVSGDAAAIERLITNFTENAHRATPLAVSHAFHSSHMDPMLEAFRTVAGSITFHPPTIPVVSNVTGKIAEPSQGDLVTADYWVRQVREPVRFGQGISTASELGVTTFLECGPHAVLCALAAKNLTDSASNSAFVPSLHKDHDEPHSFTEALCALYVRGHDIDWTGAFEGLGARRIDLPTYAFHHQRFWPPSSRPTRPASVEPAPSSLLPELVEGLETLPYAQRRDRLLDLVRREVSVQLGLTELVATDQQIQSLGLDSIVSVQIRNRLAAHLGKSLPATLLYDHGCAADIADFLAREIFGARAEEEVPNPITLPGAVDMTSDANRWLPQGTRSNAELRVFCLPFAGSGPSAFRSWHARLPESIDVCPLALPGREARLHEPAVSSLDILVPQLADALTAALDKPFVLFGQSVGALIAFELARELRSRDLPAPRRLVLASYPGPARRSELPFPAGLTDDEFIRTVGELWHAIPAEVLAEPELLARLLPPLRADFELQATSVHVSQKPLAVPISAFYGTHDPLIGPEHAVAWAEQTSHEFTLRSVAGGHLFHADPDFLDTVEAIFTERERSHVRIRE